jgi:hypothetical protein
MYIQGSFFLDGAGGATTTGFSICGAVKTGTMHCGLQHFTSLPADLGETNPFVSHMGHVTSSVLPGPGFGLTGVALAVAD